MNGMNPVVRMPQPDPRDQLRRDLDAILQGYGVMISGYQLRELAIWFDAELEERAERRRRAEARITGSR
jgi:hypothetical protein